MRRWQCLLALLIFFSAIPAFASTYMVKPGGLRVLQTPGQGEGPAGVLATQLSLECHPDADGSVGIVYSVDHPDAQKGFPFDAYEGPDAPALKKKWVKIQVTGPAGPLMETHTTVAGYYDTAERFSFGLSKPNRGNNEVTKIFRALQNGAENLLIEVSSPKDPKVVLKTSFAVKAIQADIQKLQEGCVKGK